jgi:hypothetical protein
MTAVASAGFAQWLLVAFGYRADRAPRPRTVTP